MITLLNQLEPEVTVTWAPYTTAAQIDWMHSDKRVLETEEQVYPSSGPATVVPTAIFTISTYDWSGLEW